LYIVSGFKKLVQNEYRTEEEKEENYQELAFQIKRIHGASKVIVTPIMIGALGRTSKRAKTPRAFAGTCNTF